jgi:hypothetical protein
MKTKQTRATGAFGATEVSLAPPARRGLLFDVKNCPHCGTHHASLDADVEGDRITIRCPVLRAPMTLTAKLFLHWR